MPCLQYELSAYALLISTVMFSAFILLSVKYSTIMSHDHCPGGVPKLVFTKDRDDLFKKIATAINESSSSVKMTISDFIIPQFKNYFVVPLVAARKRGVSISFVVPNEAYITDELRRCNFTNIFSPFTVKRLLELDSVITDTSAFVAPGLLSVPTNSTMQYLEFHDCQPLIEDISGFFDFYKLNESNTVGSIVPISAYSRSSAIRPTFSGNSSFFNFHSPNQFNSPMRPSLTPVLEMCFAKSPKQVKVYTRSPPQIPTDQAKESALSSFYLELMGVILPGKTNVSILVSKASTSVQGNYQAATSFLPYKNVRVHMYIAEYEGPNFVICDDRVYIFGNKLERSEYPQYLSFHTSIVDETVEAYASNFFDNVWGNSSSLNVTWGF